MTLGLSMIVKDEVERVKTLLHDLKPYVAQSYILVSDKAAYEQLKGVEGAIVEYRKWTNDFAAARNACKELITTDYWMWLDADDIVKNPEDIPYALEEMVQNNLDVLYARYDYERDASGDVIAQQWRERILKTSFKCEWKGVVHETLMGVAPRVARTDLFYIDHVKTMQEIDISRLRNHQLLERAYQKEEGDPRITYYLAVSHFGYKHWDEAIKLFREYVATSGWDEEKYRAWRFMAQCYGNTDRLEAAAACELAAIELLPGHPDAYLGMAEIQFRQDNHAKSLEFLEMGMAKKLPESLSVVDPTVYSYRPLTLLAIDLFHLGRLDEALGAITKAHAMQPKYEVIKGIKPIIEEAYYEREAIKRVKWLASYEKDKGGRVQSLVESLPSYLQTDLRLQPIRRDYLKPKVWPANSVAFYCGQGLEEWGADTLDKGMGGSEEAVVYLSRELAKAGYDVTVYGDRELPFVETIGSCSVTYVPHESFNPDDTFDTLVAWRSPSFHRVMETKARVRLLDMHDTPIGHQAISEDDLPYIDKVMLKSEYQFEMSGLPREKVEIVSNGIVLEQFNQKVKRNPLKVIYASSADRGLDYLLEMWPDIKAAVPEAQLSWAYGWNSYDAMHKGNTAQMKWKWEMIRRMADVDCISLGRLSHEELAKEMLSSGVWAYPTGFPEINAITAIKCGKAGLIPITTGFAALQETVLEPQKDWGGVMYSSDNEAVKADFKKRLIKALKEGRSEAERAKWAHKYDKFSWSEIAKGWIKCVSPVSPLPTQKNA